MPDSVPGSGGFFGPGHPKFARSEAPGARITEYAAWLNAGGYRLLEVIHEFDRERLWAQDGRVTWPMRRRAPRAPTATRWWCTFPRKL